MTGLLASSSLFAPRPGNAVLGSVQWLTGTLLGTVAISLCVIAIAFVGFQMLSGRLPIMRGLRVIVGCFLLLGAPVVAASISGLWQQSSVPPAPPASQQNDDPRGDVPPAGDPYAGASLRRD
ncbi:TrbC/VirB2 family protein [Parerythrobacter lacustris]|uniref:TrbC/VirB2 family protein n=1 Tax=Parerythrobacter lacustris TaxID=2969984 RepID=A0ABT1XSX9_9SPHN|nr:TrbC/VirB2 family protein [Parerythrobacter lacustris]